MTREEAINRYIMPALKRTWNDNLCAEIEQALEQEPCDNAISREWLKTAIHNFYYGLKHTPTEKDIQAYIDVAPSVNPQERTGHWIEDNRGFYIYAKCSECGSVHDTATNYCPNCGCLMDRTEFDEYVKKEGDL